MHVYKYVCVFVCMCVFVGFSYITPILCDIIIVFFFQNHDWNAPSQSMVQSIMERLAQQSVVTHVRDGTLTYPTSRGQSSNKT